MLLRAARLELEDAEINELVERTEGWAAGLYLAALAARARERRRASRGRPLGHRRRPLPRRLLPLRVPLAARARAPDVPAPHVGARDDVAARSATPSSSARARRSSSASLEQANLFVVPLDRHRGCLPLPPPLPRAAPAGARGARAGARPGAQPARGRLVRGAGRPRVDARLLARGRQRGERRAHPRARSRCPCPRRAASRRSSRGSTTSTTTTLQRYPAVAVEGSRIHALRGRPDAGRGLARGGGARGRARRTGEAKACIEVLRAAMCADGPEQMLEDEVRARRARARAPVAPVGAGRERHGASPPGRRTSAPTPPTPKRRRPRPAREPMRSR